MPSDLTLFNTEMMTMEPKTSEPIRITTVTQYAGDPSPPHLLPAPPVTSNDWRVWLRWGALFGLGVFGMWLTASEVGKAKDEVKEIKAEMKAMSAAHAARPVPVAAGQ